MKIALNIDWILYHFAIVAAAKDLLFTDKFLLFPNKMIFPKYIEYVTNNAAAPAAKINIRESTPSRSNSLITIIGGNAINKPGI